MKAAGRILIVDDEPRMAEVVASALRRAGNECVTRTSGGDAIELLAREDVDVIVTDWKMPGMNGMELLREIRARRPELPVILMTAFADIPSAVEAMKRGAFDYVTKPFDNDEIRTLVGRALELGRLERENHYLRQELGSRYGPESFVAESPAGRELLDLVRRVARSRSTVLLEGESGTGKELVARLLHFWSDRVGGPFVPINCKALAEGVLESELFGHERGAFTGATASHAGCFERAERGTLFLDEIGEVSPEFQGKLLRVLQEGEIVRVGGNESRRIDVRVVAATNRDLKAEVSRGSFREDLYYRLTVIPMRVPPLRDRPADVLPLARHFLAHFSAEAGRRFTLSAEAERALATHAWPGNVRELENAIERAVVLCRGEAIEPEDLLLDRSMADGPSRGVSETEGTLQDWLDQATAERIRRALEEAGGNRAEAARILGIDRSTLYRLMKR